MYRGFFRYRKYAFAEPRPIVLVRTAASGVTNGSHYQGISVRGCLAAAEERQRRARRPWMLGQLDRFLVVLVETQML